MTPAILTQATLSFQSTLDQVLSEYQEAGHTPEAINNGLCEEFAMKVLRRWLTPQLQLEGSGTDPFSIVSPRLLVEDFFLDTSKLLIADHSDWDWPLIDAHWGGEKIPVCYRRPYQKASSGGHVWMTVEGRHYDAEAPEGVDFFLDLPFFENRLFPRRVLTRTWSHIDRAGTTHAEQPDAP